MAGVHFAFKDFAPLIRLNIGMSDRLDENRAESFTILYCDFTKYSKELIAACLEQILRSSDAIVRHKGHYFFVLPYTDKYGAVTVKNMFEEFFDSYVPGTEVSYPADGDTPEELIEEIQVQAFKGLKSDLEFLDPDKIKGLGEEA